MSQEQGGQGIAGGQSFDEVRRRLQMRQPGQEQPRRAIGADVRPGGQNPAPPAAPAVGQSPIQMPQPMTASDGRRPLGGPVNPYAPMQQGGGAQKVPPPTPPGATIGPQTPEPGLSKLEMTGKPAGGQFPQAPAGGRRQLGPESRPSPQNPSPQGPQRLGGPMLKPAVGGAQAGGWQAPSWGVAGSGSAGVSNAPNPYAKTAAAPPSGQTMQPVFNGGGVSYEPAPSAPGGQPVGQPGGGYQPGTPLGNNQPRRQVGPGVSGGGGNPSI